ncbi:MAG: hypothetical protein ABI797_04975 [Chloroflexota bacterium]
MAILRFPLIAFAFLVDKLRRIPGVLWAERHVLWVVATLLLLAVVALVYWGAQRSPQRVNMVELASGQLSHMQSWIIISGDLQRDPRFPSAFRYVMTDVEAPNAKLNVTSDIERPTGQTTISGTFVGGRLPTPTGVRWTGQIAADDELAPEQDPPWVALGFVVAAVLVIGAARSSYPVLLDERPQPIEQRKRAISVGIVRGSRRERRRHVSGTLVLTLGEPVELRMAGEAPMVLRLHSPYTSVDIGELRGLSRSEAALVVRLATEEMVLTFASREDRDAAFAALAAEFEPRRADG